jgi:hypothetical protein
MGEEDRQPRRLRPVDWFGIAAVITAIATLVNACNG